jgi:hypothetical protein
MCCTYQDSADPFYVCRPLRVPMTRLFNSCRRGGFCRRDEFAGRGNGVHGGAVLQMREAAEMISGVTCNKPEQPETHAGRVSEPSCSRKGQLTSPPVACRLSRAF